MVWWQTSGPVEGKHHDSVMLVQSDLYNKLQLLDPLPNDSPVCLNVLLVFLSNALHQ